MRTFVQNEPLTDAELDRLGDFIKGCKGSRAMNVESYVVREERGMNGFPLPEIGEQSSLSAPVRAQARN